MKMKDLGWRTCPDLGWMASVPSPNTKKLETENAKCWQRHEEMLAGIETWKRAQRFLIGKESPDDSKLPHTLTSMCVE